MIGPVAQITNLIEETEDKILSGRLSSKEQYDLLIERRNTLKEILSAIYEWAEEDEDIE